MVLDPRPQHYGCVSVERGPLNSGQHRATDDGQCLRQGRAGLFERAEDGAAQVLRCQGRELSRAHTGLEAIADLHTHAPDVATFQIGSSHTRDRGPCVTKSHIAHASRDTDVVLGIDRRQRHALAAVSR